MTFTKIKTFGTDFIARFEKHDILDKSAALSFYTALALAPLLVVMLSVLGLFGHDAQQRLVDQIAGVVGDQAAEAVAVVINSAEERPDLRRLSGIIGFIVLLFSASIVFAQIQASINEIWDTADKKLTGAWGWIRRRLLSMGMVLSLGFLSAVSLVVTTFLSFTESSDGFIWQVINQFVSFAVFTFLFGAIYKFLPDLRPKWRNAIKGGVITAALFTVGKHLIGLYLGKSSVASGYGAAGSLVVFLIWVYYSSLILFVGAELAAALTVPRRAQDTNADLPRIAGGSRVPGGTTRTA